MSTFTFDEPRGDDPAVKWRVILHTYACDTCGAAPGASCRSPSGRPQHLPHVDRYRQAHDRHWLPGDVPEDTRDAAPDD